MSNKTRPSQYADARGVVVESNAPNQGLLAVANAAPTNSVSGYCKGCIYVNTAGSAPGTLVYVNTGSATSSTWLNIV